MMQEEFGFWTWIPVGILNPEMYDLRQITQPLLNSVP